MTLRKLISTKDYRTESSIFITIEKLHGNIKQVKEEYPHLISKNVAFARKLGFPELIFPGDVRNDLYVTLVSGEFVKGIKNSDKNLEVIVHVCNDVGEIMNANITVGGGSSMIEEYRSVIYYHEPKPKWNESFKVNIPIEEFKRCHLKFLFRHRSSDKNKDKNEKPFGLSYVKLEQDNGIILPDGSYKLVVYKLDKKMDKSSQFSYISLPSFVDELNAASKTSVGGYSVSNKDQFCIQTNLCSTKLTQDVKLLGLLNWTSKKENLEQSLKDLLLVSSEEIVKFLQDILDVLFKILVDNENPFLYNNLIFCDLLKIIDVVSDKKYLQFQSVLDLYINNDFSSTLAYDKLLIVLEHHLLSALESGDEVMDPNSEKSSDVQLFKTTKNLQYIMKFIIQSKLLYEKLNGDKNQAYFEMKLENLLSKFVQLMSYDKGLLKSQGCVLKHLHVIASDLMDVYDSVRIR